MKILLLCLRLVFEVSDKTKSRTTGYSYAVRDLAAEIVRSGSNTVDCVCVNDEPALKNWHGVNILKRKLFKAGIFIKPNYILKGLASGREAKAGLAEILRTEYYYYFGGWIERLIRKGAYDFVSIQGFTRYSMPYVMACEKTGVKYGVSFHALDCFGDNYHDKDEAFMASMLRFFADKKVPCTFISTTMMEKAKSCLSEEEKQKANFSVILNGASSIVEKPSIRARYGISEKEKVCLCSGNINQRKNQYQLVKAYTLLEESKKNKLRIVLVGNLMDERVENLIVQDHLQDKIILCGSVARSELGAFFSAADFTALTSLSEGFGLSIIEGFAYGLPAILWEDLDVTKDINDPECVMLVPERTNECLVRYLSDIMEKNWDKKYILNYSRSFSIESMAENYLQWFLNCINGGDENG